MNLRTVVERKLNGADVKINGNRPWDIRISDERLWKKVALAGTLGAGEAYMDGWWDCDALDQMVYKMTRSHLQGVDLFTGPARVADVIDSLRHRIGRLDPFRVGRHHYDIGNELYETMLDRRMVYSCAYWKDAGTLEEAQEQKLDLVCRKLGIQAGMRVLDIGGGWGGFAQFTAERYGACVVNLSVSKEQIALANARCAQIGDMVENRLMPYQELPPGETYDRIVSIGMFEHVTPRFYRSFFEIVRSHLTDNGLFLLHTIGKTVSASSDPWMLRYIFPDSAAPSLQEVGRGIEELFVVEDMHSFGQYYAPTLMEWCRRFESAWPELQAAYPLKYNNRFYRMWRYYLLTCAGSFRARAPQVWQFVLSKNGVPEGYEAVR